MDGFEHWWRYRKKHYPGITTLLLQRIPPTNDRNTVYQKSPSITITPPNGKKFAYEICGLGG